LINQMGNNYTFRSIREGRSCIKSTLRHIILPAIIILLLSTTAHADHRNVSIIDWRSFDRWTLEYEYEWYEDSHNVEWLQYWLSIEPRDGIYGPATFIEHHKAAQERNISIELFYDSFPSQTFIDDVERWRPIVVDAIDAMGGPSSDVNRFLRVMQCESRGLPDAYNASSGASGLMQHLERFWGPRADRAGFEGASPFDPTANIYTSAWLLYRATGGGWRHWECK